MSGSAGLYADEGTRHSAAVNKFSIPSFVLGIVIGFAAGFGVFGGACRPSPTPTDDGKPIPVSAPAEIPKAAELTREFAGDGIAVGADADPGQRHAQMHNAVTR